jgi:hypothetical protein
MMIIVFALGSLLAYGSRGSVWSEVTVFVTMVPSAMPGGVIRARQARMKKLA